MSKTLAVRLSMILLVANAPVMMAAAAKDARPAGPLSPAAAAAGHCEAWNTTDRVKRDLLLRRVFASDGVYNDPTPTYITGRVALSDEIARFQGKYPGARFGCSAPQTHHSAMRVSWLLLGRDEKVLEQGTDFYQLAPNGLIRRVTGFFGAPPPVSPSR